MPFLALIAVLLAAGTHSTWNLFAKKAAGSRHFVWLYSVGSIILYCPIIAWIVVTGRPHFERKRPFWCRSSTVSMWQFLIMELRLLRFAFMKPCCNCLFQPTGGGTRLPPSVPESYIKCYL